MSPELRDWISSKFGSTDESLLDESVYSRRELLEDKRQLKRERKRYAKERRKFIERRKRLMKKAGRVSSERKAKELARKADILAKKIKVKSKQLKAKQIHLGTVTAIEGAREIMSMADKSHSGTGDPTNIQQLINDGVVTPENAQAAMMEKMDEMGVSLELMTDIKDAVDFDVVLPELDSMTSVEEGESWRAIQRRRNNEISDEELEQEAIPEEEEEPLTEPGPVEEDVLEAEADLGLEDEEW